VTFDLVSRKPRSLNGSVFLRDGSSFSSGCGWQRGYFYEMPCAVCQEGRGRHSQTGWRDLTPEELVPAVVDHFRVAVTKRLAARLLLRDSDFPHVDCFRTGDLPDRDQFAIDSSGVVALRGHRSPLRN
jgi:hypothetical protein